MMAFRLSSFKFPGSNRMLPLLVSPIIYVLELESEMYYIGITLNFNHRLAQHMNGTGAIWTRLYKPKRVVEIIHENCTLEMEPELFECEYDASDGIICYAFQITTCALNGWVKCRMVHIHRQSIDGTITNVDYDPTIHDGTNHYMGHPYTARYNPKEKRLRIHKGDGTIFTAVVR